MALFFGQYHALKLPYPKERFIQIKWKKNLSNTSINRKNPTSYTLVNNNNNNKINNNIAH